MTGLKLNISTSSAFLGVIATVVGILVLLEVGLLVLLCIIWPLPTPKFPPLPTPPLSPALTGPLGGVLEGVWLALLVKEDGFRSIVKVGIDGTLTGVVA